MARYTGPVVRLQRRSGRNLQLKSAGSKANARLGDKPTAPGQHGAMPRKLSVYGQQLREKQALKWMYGVLEKQFRTYATKAKTRRGVAGTVLLQMLEGRLDNVVYRAGFASTRAQARQFVRHNHFLVNGRRVNIPSYQVKPGDVVRPAEKALAIKPLLEVLEKLKDVPRPTWIAFNPAENTATFLALPSRESLVDIPVNEQAVMEFYSR